MNLSRKQLQERTGLPRSSLLWLLGKLSIDPVDVSMTFYGRPVYLYEESAVERINEWLNSQLARRNLKGFVKCNKGWCNKSYPQSQIINVYCERCYALKWIRNFVTHNKFWRNDVDQRRLDLCRSVIDELK